eukprot:scaffold25445_cov183-Amphora_coffeaeformis.AAC.9
MKLSTTCFFLLTTVTSAWVSPVTRTSHSPLPMTASAEQETAMAKLKPEFAQALEMALAKLDSSIPEKYHDKMMPLLSHFTKEYMAASQDAFLAGDTENCRPDLVAKRILTAIQYGLTYGTGENKFTFDVSHDAVRGDEKYNGVDFYEFGCDFFRTVMNLKESIIMGQDNLKQIADQIAKGENVVLFANHQSEADPQVVSAGLELEGYHDIAENMVYVAGHKVTTDPLAVPFSMGRNLLCIHSKKHIDADPETKPMKQKQNLRAMNALLNKLKKGGTLLWVAPSGGRDRRNVETREVPLAPFDNKTIDIFRLMGTKSKVPTHYYTLAMVSYDLCPPPDFVVPGVGEPRNVRYVPIGLYFGKEVESVGGLEHKQTVARHAMEQCSTDYEALLEAFAKK